MKQGKQIVMALGALSLITSTGVFYSCSEQIGELTGNQDKIEKKQDKINKLKKKLSNKEKQLQTQQKESKLLVKETEDFFNRVQKANNNKVQASSKSGNLSLESKRKKYAKEYKNLLGRIKQEKAELAEDKAELAEDKAELTEDKAELAQIREDIKSERMRKEQANQVATKIAQEQFAKISKRNKQLNQAEKRLIRLARKNGWFLPKMDQIPNIGANEQYPVLISLRGAATEEESQLIRRSLIGNSKEGKGFHVELFDQGKQKVYMAEARSFKAPRNLDDTKEKPYHNQALVVSTPKKIKLFAEEVTKNSNVVMTTTPVNAINVDSYFVYQQANETKKNIFLKRNKLSAGKNMVSQRVDDQNQPVVKLDLTDQQSLSTLDESQNLYQGLNDSCDDKNSGSSVLCIGTIVNTLVKSGYTNKAKEIKKVIDNSDKATDKTVNEVTSQEAIVDYGIKYRFWVELPSENATERKAIETRYQTTGPKGSTQYMGPILSSNNFPSINFESSQSEIDYRFHNTKGNTRDIPGSGNVEHLIYAVSNQANPNVSLVKLTKTDDGLTYDTKIFSNDYINLMDDIQTTLENMISQ